MTKHLTVAQVVERWQSSENSVLQAIHVPGGLKAINISNSRRPRWRIREDDLERYERSRENQTVSAPGRARRVAVRPT